MASVVARVACASIVAVGVLAGSAQVASATPSAKLVYVRAAGTAACPDESELRRSVATRIGYDPFFPTASKTVVAQVSRAPKGYRAKVQIVGDDGIVRGEREIATRGDDCGELISAIALAVSIALDDLDDGKTLPAPAAERALEATSVEPAAPTAAAAGAAPDTSPRDADAPPSTTPAATGTAAAKRLVFAASLGPAVSFGAAPSPSVGGALAATARYAWFAARLDFRADLPAGGDIEGGGTVTTRSILGGASACVRGDIPFVCAGGALGSFATSTTGIARTASDSALLLTLVAMAGVDVSLTPQLFVEPLLEGDLAMTRHRVVIDGIERYSLPIFAGTVKILLGWRFL